MSVAKYIIIDEREPVIFPDTMTHADVANALGGAHLITSAGFVHIDWRGAYSAYGESISLKKKSKPEEDSTLINRRLGGRQ